MGGFRSLIFFVVASVLSRCSGIGERPCELAFPRANDNYFHATSDDTVNIMVYVACRFTPTTAAFLAGEGVVASVALQPVGSPHLRSEVADIPLTLPLLPESIPTRTGQMVAVHREFTFSARAYRMDVRGQDQLDRGGDDNNLLGSSVLLSESGVSRFFQLALDLHTANTSRLVDSFNTQIRLTATQADVGLVHNTQQAATCDGEGLCELPDASRSRMQHAVDYLEIGTSDFDTLVHKAAAANAMSAGTGTGAGTGGQNWRNYSGVSVEPMSHYYRNLPQGPGLMAINAAVAAAPGTAGVYGFDPAHMRDKNDTVLKGCSSIDTVHRAAKALLNADPGLSTLVLMRQPVAVLTVGEVFHHAGMRSAYMLKVDAEGMDFTIVRETLAFLSRFNLEWPCVISFESNSRHPSETSAGKAMDTEAQGETFQQAMGAIRDSGAYALFEVFYRESGMDVGRADNSDVWALHLGQQCRAGWGRVRPLLNSQISRLFELTEEEYAHANSGAIIMAHALSDVD